VFFVIKANILDEFLQQFRAENVPVCVDDASGCFGLRHSELLEIAEWACTRGVCIKYVLSSVLFGTGSERRPTYANAAKSREKGNEIIKEKENLTDPI
jgi:hypothetical protein